MVILQYHFFILFRKVVICKVKGTFLLLSHHLESVFSCCSWTATVDKPTKESSEPLIIWISHIKNLIYFLFHPENLVRKSTKQQHVSSFTGLMAY